MEYKFSGQINYDDFMQFQRFNLKHVINTIFPKTVKFQIVIFLLIIIIVDFKKNSSLQNILIWIGIILIIGSIYLILYYSKTIYKKYYSMMIQYIFIKNQILQR